MLQIELSQPVHQCAGELRVRREVYQKVPIPRIFQALRKLPDPIPSTKVRLEHRFGNLRQWLRSPNLSPWPRMIRDISNAFSRRQRIMRCLPVCAPAIVDLALTNSEIAVIASSLSVAPFG